GLAALAAQLRAGGRALGLLQQAPSAWFGRGTSADDDLRIQGLVEERAAAKKARDFARADAIREQLAAEGVVLEDTPQGVRWKRG
ncbi:MAG TPA: cysteine--tRNA ligase, partial [Luteimonas sp.]